MLPDNEIFSGVCSFLEECLGINAAVNIITHLVTCKIGRYAKIFENSGVAASLVLQLYISETKT